MPIITNPYFKILDEITPTSNYISSKQEYVAWYKRHYKTIAEQPYSDFCMQELIWTFHEFKNLISFLEHEQTIIEANNRYILLDQENEEEIIEWLLDYENVYEIAEHFYCLHFEWEDDKIEGDKIEGDKIVVSKELDIKIALSDFKEFIVFEENFRPFLTKFKEKLSTKELKPFDISLQSMLEFHKNF